jgi:hypothetical protein
MTTTTSFNSNSRGTAAGIARPSRTQKPQQCLKAGHMYQGIW